MMLGDMLKKTGLVKDQSFNVEFIKGSEVVTTKAKKGEKLSAVAENAGGTFIYIHIIYYILYISHWCLFSIYIHTTIYMKVYNLE